LSSTKINPCVSIAHVIAARLTFGCLCLLVVGGCKAYDAGLIEAPQRRSDDSAAAVAEACSARTDSCNGVDDDCDGVVDEQGNDSCKLPNADVRCIGGACVIENCNEGFLNCNRSASDGCERNVADGCSDCEGGCDAMVPAAKPSGDAQATPNKQTPNQTLGPTPLDLDGGEAQASDDGGVCDPAAPERCNAFDDDCDGKVDEGGVCDSCIAAHPSAQTSPCDRCVCQHCGSELDACEHSDDSAWNSRCTALLGCFGKNVLANACGPINDCYQNGAGPCTSQVNMAATWSTANCGTDPVRSPCGAFQLLHMQCLRDKCGSVCEYQHGS
jgi:hypothetical protein